jgi:histidinol-phosphate aminotransferase
VDFGGESAVPLIAEHPNLLVVQTMSKSRALAGLRVGYALGDTGLIEALRRVKDSFNSYPLGRIAQAGAVASLRDDAWFRQSCAKVIAGREAMTKELVRLGMEVLPSSANFVFARHPAIGGAEFAAGLREQAVLVRHFNKPRTAPYLRITVGTEADTAKLVAAAAKALGK